MFNKACTCDRRHLLRSTAWIAGGMLFTPLIHAQANSAIDGRDAWKQAQPGIQNALSWVESVTRSLDGLCDTINRLLIEKADAERKARDLLAELERLKAEMARQMGEYRSGLFCSGCNQTKSEILAKGDEFPHPGFKILRPTEQQIAAKEVELQRPIDRVAEQLVKQRAVIDSTRPRVDFGLEQIVAGLKLWRTAITWWTLASHSAIKMRSQQLREEQGEAMVAIEKIRFSLNQPASQEQIAALDSEYRVWVRQLERQRGANEKFTADAQQATTLLVQKRDAARARLEAALSRSPLQQAVTGTVNSSPVSQLISALDLGLDYLMGQLPSADSLRQQGRPSHQGSVAQFVNGFRQASFAAGVALEAAPMSISPGAVGVSVRPTQSPTSNRLLDRLP